MIRPGKVNGKGVLKCLSLLISVSVTAGACTVQKQPSQFLLNKESYCNPPVDFNGYRYTVAANSDSVLAANKDLSRKYSVQSILTMHALGVLENVRAIERLKEDTANTLHLLQQRQQITDKLMLANSEIAAVAAELDCEGERIDQVAAYVDNINSRRNSKFTVASIAIGAVSAIAGALITDSDWEKGVAIGGGVAGLGLGFATLNPKGKKVTLLHKRNLLQMVWEEKNNHGISPFLWYMLTERRISNSGASSLLNNLKQRWITYQFDGNAAAAAKSVNFTAGGVYAAADLHTRAAMINQLQALIRSVAQNLNIYLQELII